MDDTTLNPKKKRIKKEIPPSLLKIFQDDSYDGKNLNSLDLNYLFLVSTYLITRLGNAFVSVLSLP